MMVDTRVNGLSLKAYHAELVEYTVSECDYDKGYILPPARLIPEKIKTRLGLRTVTITLDFEGDHLHEIATVISMFTAALRKEANLLLPDGYYYWCEYSKASVPKQKAPWIQQVKFTLAGFRHGPLEYRTVSGVKTIAVGGNYETPAIIRLLPDAGVTQISVNGITIRNVNGEVTIDGIYTTVHDAAGNNKFADTDMTAWPTLQPGDNTITISDGVTAEISYYPIFQ